MPPGESLFVTKADEKDDDGLDEANLDLMN